jgi:hypothetical protein
VKRLIFLIGRFFVGKGVFAQEIGFCLGLNLRTGRKVKV